MLDHSLEAFARAVLIDAVVLVVPPSLAGRLDEELTGAPKVCAVTGGGDTRQESLGRGLASLPEGTAVVAVHDAARPLVTPEVVNAVVAGVGGGFDGAIAAVPLDDAVKAVGEASEILGPRSRAGLWRAQTPQAFAVACLAASLAKAQADGVVCDDCSEMAGRAGFRVRVIPGDPRNIKVTRPADLALAEALLR